MKAIDQVLVEGQGEQFALLAPEVINDYVETLGKPCQNPLGYTAGSLILAKDLEGVQRMFKVTANISSSQNVVEGTNVERKKLEDLFDGIEEEIGDVDQELGSVKQALANEVVTRSTLGAHNLLPNDAVSVTKNGVTFIVNADMSITISTGSGGATANSIVGINTAYKPPKGTYKLSSGISDNKFYLTMDAYNGNTWIKGLGNTASGDAVFTVDYVGYDTIRVYVAVLSGAVYTTAKTIYPMIRLATDSDPTYQPYAKTNVGLTQNVIALSENQLANGAVNLMENKGVTETVGTIAWVVNSDKSVTGNGTSAPSSGDYTLYYIIHDTSDEWLHLKAGVKYKFSCCPSGGSADTYFVQFLYRTGVGEPSLSFGNDTGNGIEFTPSTDVICYVRVAVKKTVTISNKVFKPMLTYGDIPNSDYSHYSYAKSNEELTESVEITELSSFTSYLGSTITTLFGNLIKRGKIVTINFYWEGSATNVQEIITLPSEYRPSTYKYGGGTVKLNGATEPSVYQITSDGKICQAKTGIACVGGSCSIVYSI